MQPPQPKPVQYIRRTPEATALHRYLCANYADFAREVRETFDAPLPDFVREAISAYIGCGQLARGFVRLRCVHCKTDQLVAFSCKTRGLCPSCDGKRMTETAAHLVDHVIPEVPIRQWVITFPHEIRYLLAWNTEVRTAVLEKFMLAVQAHYTARAKAAGIEQPGKIGAISVAQRFNSALDLDFHWHVLVTDGLWHGDAGNPEFWTAPPLYTLQVWDVLEDAQRRIFRWLKKRGWTERETDPNAKKNPVLASMQQAAMRDQRIKERPVQREKGVLPFCKPAGRNCIHSEGFSLHANTRVAPMDRTGLEKLCKYLMRPAIAANRLEILPNDRIRVVLKTPWRDGTTSVQYDRAAFLQRIVAQIPLPRKPMLRYHGAFAPNAKIRRKVVPSRIRARKHTHTDPSEVLSEVTRATKLKWSEALKRSFDIDILQCECGHRKVLIAVIPEGADGRRLLKHLGLPTTPCDIEQARGPPEAFELPEHEQWAADFVDQPFFDDVDQAA